MALMLRMVCHLPGFARYLVFPLKEEGYDNVSNWRPTLHHLDRILTCLAKHSSLNRSTSPLAHCPTALKTDARYERTIPSFGFWFAVSLQAYQQRCAGIKQPISLPDS